MIEEPAEHTADTGEVETPPFEKLSSEVLLRGSDLLTAREASGLLAQAPGRVVVWAGERRSGKTTLTIELYERHRTGAANTAFSGSSTLLALEERIHPARSESGRVRPYTSRTELDPDGRELLHFSVSNPPVHLLFADLPGELFRQIRDNEIKPSSAALLGRTDKLGILVDGALIADPARRSSAVSYASQLIDRLGAGGIPTPHTQARLILTKLDKVVLAGQPMIAYWTKHEEKLLAKLQRFSPDAQAARTAARGYDGEDDGMEALMQWLLEPPIEHAEPLAASTGVDLPRFQRLRQPKVAP